MQVVNSILESCNRDIAIASRPLALSFPADFSHVDNRKRGLKRKIPIDEEAVGHHLSTRHPLSSTQVLEQLVHDWSERVVSGLIDSPSVEEAKGRARELLASKKDTA